MNELLPSKEGLRSRSCNLWMDARRRTACSFISHAHGDHIGRHDQSIGTAATLALMNRRLRAANSVFLPAEYGRPFTFGPLRLELLPAGHILGSAQLRIEIRGHRTVYTGDINTATSLTSEPIEVARCETLIIESTFGHPKYRFPPKAEIHERIAGFAQKALDEGATPVFFAYALGKTQEAAKILCERGFRVRVHPDAWPLCEIYLAHGVKLPNVAPLAAAKEEGEVIVAPPRMRGSRMLEKRGELRTCLLSGWALDPGAKYRSKVDEAIPLSDHADFDGLVNYAVASGAKEVLVHHGSADVLARELRERGIEARSLEPNPQLELF